jgi:rhodanese-related sulfurtransferase
MTNEDDDTMLDPAVLHLMLLIVCVLAGAPGTVLPCSTLPVGLFARQLPYCCGASTTLLLWCVHHPRAACAVHLPCPPLCPHSRVLVFCCRSGNARASAAAAVWFSAIDLSILAGGLLPVGLANLGMLQHLRGDVTLLVSASVCLSH